MRNMQRVLLGHQLSLTNSILLSSFTGKVDLAAVGKLEVVKNFGRLHRDSLDPVLWEL
jgi:hypothetical protein